MGLGAAAGMLEDAVGCGDSGEESHVAWTRVGAAESRDSPYKHSTRRIFENPAVSKTGRANASGGRKLVS
jgi:hypothetical protein